jgi:hypothetical protein
LDNKDTMKKTTKSALRAKSLDTTGLEKATGGRGSYCGGVIHCDCGFKGDWYSFYIDLSGAGCGSFNMCPSCYADPYA